MTVLSALIIATLFGCGTYLILQRGFVRILFGFSLITHAANVFLISLSGDPAEKIAPIVADPKLPNYADPLPQALILTAIVIGFGVTAYLIVLLYKIFHSEKSADLQTVHEDKT